MYNKSIDSITIKKIIARIPTDKTGVKMNKPIDAYNHAIDAMRYAIMSQLENPNKGNYFIY